jgi:hypothetical protein
LICITALGDDDNKDYPDAYKQSVVNKKSIPNVKDVSQDYFEDDGDDFNDEE